MEVIEIFLLLASIRLFCRLLCNFLPLDHRLLNQVVGEVDVRQLFRSVRAQNEADDDLS